MIATSKQVAGDISANAAKTQAVQQKIIDNKDGIYTPEQIAAAKAILVEALTTQKDWGTGGKYNQALGAATALVVDGVAGQGGAATANAFGAVMAKQIGDLADKNQWVEGSAQKVILHGLSGLIQAKLGGTDALSGMSANALKEALNPVMESFLVSQGYDKKTPEFNEMMKLGSVLVGAATGAAIGGGAQNINAGATIALINDQNNRTLHDNEKRRIKELAKGDQTVEIRLLIASCALIKCSAEFVKGSPEYIQSKRMEDAGNSDAFKLERDLLSVQTTFNIGKAVTEVKLFDYGSVDKGLDSLALWNNTTGFTTRLGGAAQVVGGYVAGTASSGLVVTGAPTCPATLGVGCLVAAAGVVGVAWSSDQIVSGTQTFATGRPTPTLGGQLVSNVFGVSPQMGELLNGLAGLSPFAIDAALTNNATKAWAAANAVAKETYASNLVSGELKTVGSGSVAANDASYLMPKGYIQNANGTITGPKGATYEPTGALDLKGNQIYRNVTADGKVNGYYTLSENGGAQTSLAPSTLAGQTPGSIVAQSNKAHEAANTLAAANFQSQGFNIRVQTNVTMDAMVGGCKDTCIADQIVTAVGRTSLQVPPGFIATDLNGKVLTSIPLNSKGQVIIEIKTGAGDLTSGQAAVYPAAQIGNAVGRGGNAVKAGVDGSVSATPIIILRKK